MPLIQPTTDGKTFAYTAPTAIVSPPPPQEVMIQPVETLSQCFPQQPKQQQQPQFHQKHTHVPSFPKQSSSDREELGKTIESKEEIIAHLVKTHDSLVTKMIDTNGLPPIFSSQQKDLWKPFLDEFGFALFSLNSGGGGGDGDDDNTNESFNNGINFYINNNISSSSSYQFYNKFTYKDIVTSPDDNVDGTDGEQQQQNDNTSSLPSNLVSSIFEEIRKELDIYSSAASTINGNEKNYVSKNNPSSILEKRGGILQGFKCPLSLIQQSSYNDCYPSNMENNSKSSSLPPLTMVSPLCQSAAAWETRGCLTNFWRTITETDKQTSLLSSVEGFIVVDDLPLKVQPSQPLSWSPLALSSTKKKGGGGGGKNNGEMKDEHYRMFVSFTDNNASFGLIPGASDAFNAICKLDPRKSRRIQKRPYDVQMNNEKLNFLFDYVLQLVLPAETVCVWKTTVPFTVFQHKTNFNPATKRKKKSNITSPPPSSPHPSSSTVMKQKNGVSKIKIYNPIYKQLQQLQQQQPHNYHQSTLIYNNQQNTTKRRRRRRRRQQHNRHSTTDESIDAKYNTRAIGQLISFFPRSGLTEQECKQRVNAFNSYQMLNNHKLSHHSWSNQGKRPDIDCTDICLPPHRDTNYMAGLLSDNLKSIIGFHSYYTTYPQRQQHDVNMDATTVMSPIIHHPMVPEEIIPLNECYQPPLHQQLLIPPQQHQSQQWWQQQMQSHLPLPPQQHQQHQLTSFSTDVIDNSALLNLSNIDVNNGLNYSNNPLSLSLPTNPLTNPQYFPDNNNGHYQENKRNMIIPFSGKEEEEQRQQQQFSTQLSSSISSTLINQMAKLFEQQNLKIQKQFETQEINLNETIEKQKEQLKKACKEVEKLKKKQPISFKIAPSRKIEYIKSKSNKTLFRSSSSSPVSSSEKLSKSAHNVVVVINNEKAPSSSSNPLPPPPPPEQQQSDLLSSVSQQLPPKRTKLNNGIAGHVTNILYHEKDEEKEEMMIEKVVTETSQDTPTRCCFICNSEFSILNYTHHHHNNNSIDHDNKNGIDHEKNHLIPKFRNQCYHCVGCRDHLDDYKNCEDCDHCCKKNEKNEVIGHYIFSRDNMPIKKIKTIKLENFNNELYKHFICNGCDEKYQIL